MASDYSMPRPTPPRASSSCFHMPAGPIGVNVVPVGRRVTNCRNGLQLVSAAKSVGTQTDDRKLHARSGQSTRRWQRVARNLGCILVFSLLVWAIRLTRQRFHLPHRSVSRRLAQIDRDVTAPVYRLLRSPYAHSMPDSPHLKPLRPRDLYFLAATRQIGAPPAYAANPGNDQTCMHYKNAACSRLLSGVLLSARLLAVQLLAEEARQSAPWWKGHRHLSPEDAELLQRFCPVLRFDSAEPVWGKMLSGKRLTLAVCVLGSHITRL